MNPNPRPPADLARNLLVVVILSALMIGSLYVLKPFLFGLIWATTIVVATWPVMLAVQKRCGGRRWMATVAMLIVLLVVIVLPLYQAISTLALHGGAIMTSIKSLPDYALMAPPGWVQGIPLGGPRIAQEWQALADAGAGGAAGASGALCDHGGQVAAEQCGHRRRVRHAHADHHRHCRHPL